MLDEVQVAGKQHLGCFVDAHDGKTEPSFLRPLIRTLTDANNIVVVASGTGFSFKDFKYWSRSGVGKEIPWEVIYSTGDFMKQEMQSSYITRYLPPSFLSSHSGEVLESRMYKWLRGRHRFTARFLEELLQGLWEQKGPAAPHKLLNVYVDQLSNFTPLDCKSTLLEQEPDVTPNTVDEFQWDRIERDPHLLGSLTESIYEYIARGAYPEWQNESAGWQETWSERWGKYRKLVEIGLARFTEKDDITITEPLALVNAICHFEAEGRPFDGNVLAHLQGEKVAASEEADNLAPARKRLRSDRHDHEG